MNDKESGPPRILLEGGPFYRHTRYILWFLLGCIVGVVIAFIIAFHAIQQSRFNSCETTNSRNRQTTRTLKGELAGASVSSETERKNTLRFTIALIDDLVPYKDCHKAVS